MDHLVEVSRSLAHLFRYKRCVCPGDPIPIYDIDHGVEMYRFFGTPRAQLYDTQSKSKDVSIIASLCVWLLKVSPALSLGCGLCHVAQLQDIATLAATVSKQVYNNLHGV